ncbi:MAG: hypothetical protein AAFO95_17865, partial [Cyanobacteria bacterium J06600_6]
MKLIKDVVDRGSEPEAQVWFSLFDRYIDLCAGAKDNFSWDYAQTCAVYLNSLADELVDRLCIASINYCNTYLEDTGQKLIRFSDRRAVLDSISPITLIIPEMLRSEPVIHLELNCTWEPEHGLEWIIRGDRILFVSAFEGEDPWGEFLDAD